MKPKDIMWKLLEYISNYTNCSFHILSSNDGDDYYDDCEFNTFIGPNKKWMLGMWINDNGDGKFKISLFAEHKWMIDKFRPSATAISHSFKISEDDINAGKWPIDVSMFCWYISTINDSPVGAFIKFYFSQCHSDGSLVKWLLSNWFFYTIKNPLVEWYRDYGMIVPLMFAKLLYKIRFGRCIDVKIESMRDFAMPKWNFKVIYKTDNDDDTFNTYCVINTKDTKPGDNKIIYRKLFLPNCIFDGYVDLVNVIDPDDNNGFYYDIKLEYENDEKTDSE